MLTDPHRRRAEVRPDGAVRRCLRCSVAVDPRDPVPFGQLVVEDGSRWTRAPTSSSLATQSGKMLPVSEWPDELVNCITAVSQTEQGTKIVLNNTLAARRILAEITGKIKNPLSSGGTLARILAGDFDEDADE